MDNENSETSIDSSHLPSAKAMLASVENRHQEDGKASTGGKEHWRLKSTAPPTTNQQNDTFYNRTLGKLMNLSRTSTDPKVKSRADKTKQLLIKNHAQINRSPTWNAAYLEKW